MSVEAKHMDTIEVPQNKIVKQGSFKKNIEKLKKWSTSSGGSFKRPPKMKTLSLNSPTDDDDQGKGAQERRKFRPIVASVFGQDAQPHYRCIALDASRVFEAIEMVGDINYDLDMILDCK